MKKLTITVAVWSLIGVYPVLGGTPAAPPAGPTIQQGTPPSTGLVTTSPFRLFDPSRLTMRQSYSVGFFSGGRGAGSIGLYMNSIGYQVSRPLYVQFDLGIAHNPGALWGSAGAGAGARVLPGFFMRYAPSPRFQFILDVRSWPGSAGLTPWTHGPR